MGWKSHSSSGVDEFGATCKFSNFQIFFVEFGEWLRYRRCGVPTVPVFSYVSLFQQVRGRKKKWLQVTLSAALGNRIDGSDKRRLILTP